MATTPVPAFIAPPDFPALSDRASGTYNSKAYAWADAMQDTTGPNIHAIAVTAKDNADDAAANTLLTDADRVQTGLDRVATAADRVQTGLDRVQTGADRNAAEASRIAASKLNLGNKASAPTLDNQGDALLAGATYYDTTLNKWRVWTGVAWGDGISAIAGVSSLNGLTGDVSGIATDAGLAAKQATLVSGTNLKTINGASLLGSGDMVVGSGTYHKIVTQSSATFVVPADTYKIRAYAGGKGGDGVGARNAGSGGGFAFGDITATPGESLTIDITSGVAKVSRGATDLLTANPGNNGSGTSAVAGGTASIDASVANGAAYSGGIGIYDGDGVPGGGSAGSPLGTGFAGSVQGYGGGIGGVGGSLGGGGAGGAGNAGGSGGAGGAAGASVPSPGPGRVILFSDPLLAHCVAAGQANVAGTNTNFQAGPGAGGGINCNAGFGGGGGVCSTGSFGGTGGDLGGGGGGSGGGTGGSSLACGGGGAGGGGGGAGGPATVWIYY